MLREVIFNSNYLALGGPPYPFEIKGPISGSNWILFGIFLSIAMVFFCGARIKAKPDDGFERFTPLQCYFISALFVVLAVCSAVFL